MLSMVAGGLLATVPLATVAAASPGWSAPAPVDETTPGQLDSVSCPTASFCMAVDENGRALTYNGHTWSGPVSLQATGPMSSVSCASASLCAALDYNGEAFIYNGHHWSAPDVIDNGVAMPSVSCAPGTSFCIGVSGDGGPYGFIYRGSGWSSAVLMDTGATTGMGAVSCPTASFCMAVDVNGNAVSTSDGGSSWSAPVSFDPSHSPDSVSCSSPTFCVAVDTGGQAATYSGSWGAPQAIDGEQLTSVSCLAGGDCVAVDAHDVGFFTTDSGADWTANVGVGPDQYNASLAVSCVTYSLCIVVDSIGQYFTFDTGTWGTPVLIDEAGSNLSSVSCVSSVFCVAVDSNGNAVTYNGSSWSSPVSIDPNQVDAVSCASTTLCVAVDDAGQETTYNGSSWSAPNEIEGDGFGLTSVSCTAVPTTFCTAVDTDGDALTSSDGISWAETGIEAESFLTSVSCATASFCVAVDNEGNALLYNGTTWSAPDAVDEDEDLSAVSCTTTPTVFCAAVDQDGNGVTYDGTWSAPSLIVEFSLTSVSCATASSCLAVDNDGHVVDIDGSHVDNIDQGTPLSALSCPTTAFCVAVDVDGNALVDNGGTSGVAVSNVSPNNGPVSGGTSVTITGTGFTADSAVDFAGVQASGISVVNSTTITATAPAEAAGTVDVIVTAAGGSSSPNPADQFTYTVTQSPTTTGCDPTCTTTVSTPLDQTQVSATASSASPEAQVSLVVNTDTVACSGTYNYATAVSTLSATGFASGETVTVAETVANEPNKKGVKVCYEATGATMGTFLRPCHAHNPHPPCISSLVEDHGSVVATFQIPATDPRFWAGAGADNLTSFSPTSGAPGRKVTIKGKDLTQVSAVVIGGAQARILSRSASKVVVDVPQGAITGLISVTSDSGVVVSAVPFTVT